METIAEKIAKAQSLFGTDAAFMNTLTQHLQNNNYTAYSNDFSAAAISKGINLTADEVAQHFNFPQTPSVKEQIKETVKDEVKEAAKEEATGRVEDALGNQLGVDLGGVGEAAGGILDTIKGWFGGGKKK